MRMPVPIAVGTKLLAQGAEPQPKKGRRYLLASERRRPIRKPARWRTEASARTMAKPRSAASMPSAIAILMDEGRSPVDIPTLPDQRLAWSV